MTVFLLLSIELGGIYFKPCKLSEIRDDYKLQKFITEMTELEESDDDDDDDDDY